MRSTQIEVSFEQHEVWHVSTADRSEPLMCTICVGEMPMITAENAAVVFKVSPRRVYQLIDSGLLHYVETTNMQVLICLSSLSKRSTERNEPKVIAAG